MVTRDELTNAIHNLIGNDLLTKANKVDENANGVQIHGSDEITKVALGVSANLDFFHEAVNAGAQYTILHHGLHFAGRYTYNSRLDQAIQNNLRFVFANNLTVSAYHYALDAHKEIGNSAVIIRELGAKRLEIPYMEEGWGWVAEYDAELKVTDIAARCAEIFHHDVFAVYSGLEKVQRIGVCTGAAKPVGAMLHEIHDNGIGLHITGEITHSGINIAKDAGFNYFAAGHHATEVFGVQELGKKLKAKYKNKLAVEFIDIPNPL